MTLSERNHQLVRSASGDERNFSDCGLINTKISEIDVRVRPKNPSFKAASSALEPDDSARRWYIEVTHSSEQDKE